MRALVVDSPLGPLTVAEQDGSISHLHWGAVHGPRGSMVLEAAREQLDAYFLGRLQSFNLPLAPRGTPFRQRVWQEMCNIDYGCTKTYGELAALAGGSAQSVGTSCGENPIPIIIPCHRVIAAGGGMGGYSGEGGLKTKRYLLDLEGWTGLSPGPLFAATAHV